MFKENIVIEYLKTILITMLVVLLVAIVFVFFTGERIISEETSTYKQKDALEDYMVGVLIEKNNYLASKFPKTYKYNLKLASLYDYKKDYQEAENEFIKAVKKAPFGNYEPVYKQACFYVQNGKYKKAQNIMNSMGELPNKQLIEYKGDFYKFLADKLMQEDYYALAIIKYEKALFYQTKIRINPKKLNETKNNLIDAYLKLADKYAEIKETEEEIKILEKAHKLVPSVVVKYKLAQTLANSEPKRTAELFAEVMKKDPSLVDFKLYYDVLNQISDDEFYKGNETLSELYRVKALNLEKYAIRNIIYPNDLSINNIKVEFLTDNKHKRNDIKLSLKLKNESPFTILNLTIVVIFKDGEKIFSSFVKNIFNKEILFPAHETTPFLIIEASQPFKAQNNLSDSITIEIYAFKNEKFKQLIMSYNVKKPKEFTQVRPKSAFQIFLKALPFSSR